MDAFEFVEAIRTEVRDSAVEGVMSSLEYPPGRNPSAALVDLSAWYRSLPQAGRDRVREIAAMAANGTVFGLFAVLDGVRVVDESPEKGSFQIRYVKNGEVTLINGSSNPPLHEILQQE